jgi:hypothetical protein
MGEKKGKMSVAIKGNRREPSGDKTILNLDCVNVNIPAVTFYNLTRCYH